ncbi:hypothetical protein GCM10011352_35360 [Marinobacterium zhoushanense]|uniref:Uncharacterized protein n=1 Tax=Marinobacterium zhoushanense TaxID=1679163 RepID=A0ABQ1KNW2_9GAMM|nr:hypothetical protein [Marinobacterium zhoushanense]GGC06080.1 hypothetical protein GCM10011352_35360 [Marinobacterium zhoushanense]
MLTRLFSSLFISLMLLLPALAEAGQPNFMPSVWGDGMLWGTKGTTELPAPTDRNVQSFDALYVIINNPDAVQFPVSEAAPGNPAYNGGRWFTHTVMWTEEGLEAHDPVPVLTSYEDILFHESLGHLLIVSGSFDGGPAPYFQCPLLPVLAY